MASPLDNTQNLFKIDQTSVDKPFYQLSMFVDPESTVDVDGISYFEKKNVSVTTVKNLITGYLEQDQLSGIDLPLTPFPTETELVAYWTTLGLKWINSMTSNLRKYLDGSRLIISEGGFIQPLQDGQTRPNVSYLLVKQDDESGNTQSTIVLNDSDLYETDGVTEKEFSYIYMKLIPGASKITSKTDLVTKIDAWYSTVNSTFESEIANGAQEPVAGQRAIDAGNALSPGNPKFWDVTAINNMSSTFKNKSLPERMEQLGFFHPDIRYWNMINVISIESMFEGSSFNNPLSTWDRLLPNVSSLSSGINVLLNMKKAFASTTAFNQDLSNWSTGSVLDMNSTFFNARNFNNGDPVLTSTKPLTWNTSNVRDMRGLFMGDVQNGVVNIFNQDISTWNTGNVLNMNATFSGAIYFDQDLSSWTMTNVQRTRNMFYYASSFNNKGNSAIGNWNFENLIDTSNMFNAANSFNHNIGKWNVKKVKDFSNMFKDNTAFDNGGSNIIDQWKIGNSVPVITVLGSNPATVVVGSTYTDAGATVTDDSDNNVTVSTIGTVDTNTIGTYTLAYISTNDSNNTATATRTVNVVSE